MLKKVVSVSLVILIFLSSFINTALFVYLKREAKVRAKKFIEKNAETELIEQLTIHRSELLDKSIFRMVEEGEFIYKGCLYDIIEWREEGEFVQVKCINDTYEEKIIEQYVNSENGGKNLAGLLAKFLKNLSKYDFQVIAESYFYLVDNYSNSLFPYYSAVYSSFYLDKPDPPPKNYS